LAETTAKLLAEKPSTEPLAKPPAKLAEDALAESVAKPDTADTTESSAVEPQKETATATVTATTASGTPLQLQLPPITINFLSLAGVTEGHRDQPKLEAKPEATPSQEPQPTVIMPLGAITKEIEVTTKGMELQIGSTVLIYYDWLRSRGYDRFGLRPCEGSVRCLGLLVGSCRPPLNTFKP